MRQSHTVRPFRAATTYRRRPATFPCRNPPLRISDGELGLLAGRWSRTCGKDQIIDGLAAALPPWTEGGASPSDDRVQLGRLHLGPGPRAPARVLGRDHRL